MSSNKKSWMFAILFTGIIAFISYTVNSREKPCETLKMARYSYETGCLESAIYLCPLLKDREKISNCQELALDKCPKRAIEFMEWLRNKN